MDRLDRLQAARLYLVADLVADDRVTAALRGGVDVLQLRMKGAPRDEVRPHAARWRALAHAHDALFVLNDDPDLAAEVGADGVHVGQDDVAPATARAVLGADAVVGLSTHAPAQAAAAIADPSVSYFCAGPVWATPTKPGRPAAGLGYVEHTAAAGSPKPWFAIGGIDAGNVAQVVAAGAPRIVVVRAITEAADPRAAAAHLRRALEVQHV